MMSSLKVKSAIYEALLWNKPYKMILDEIIEHKAIECFL